MQQYKLIVYIVDNTGLTYRFPGDYECPQDFSKAHDGISCLNELPSPQLEHPAFLCDQLDAESFPSNQGNLMEYRIKLKPDDDQES